MSAATVSLPDMGEWNITSQIKIDGQIAPDFSFDWEVVFQGHKYIMPLRKPQGSKENTTLNSVVDLTFQHWAIYQLKRWYFFTAQPVETGTAIPDKYIATVSLNLGDFCALFGTILNYYYGDKITISLDPQWQYKSEAEVVEISYSHIWDVLIKLYEVYGVRWVIEPNGSPDKYVIKVGYPTTEQSHIFEYGFEGGLLKVERQVQSDEIANMLLGRGGEKNLPYRYFKNIDPENPSFNADPDWIEELKTIYFPNLMPATFRSYVQGWKAAHISKYPGYKAVGEDNAYAPWAYRKGFTDEKFDPVEYVADEITINPETGDKIAVISPTYSPYVKKDSSIAKYGALLNGLENNDEIYPTIQGVTIDPYGRIDEVIEVEPITSDDVEEAAESDAQITTLETLNPVTLTFDRYERRSVTLSGELEVKSGKTGNLITDIDVKARQLSSVVRGRVVHPGNIVDGAIAESVSVVLTNKSTGKTYSASGIPEGRYSYKVVVEVHNTRDEPLYVTVGCVPRLQDATLSDKWTNVWRIWVKNIWQTSKQGGETNEEYAKRVWQPILGDREGNEAKVVFASGMLAHEDYEFTITAIPKYDRKLCKWQTVENGKVVEHEYWSEWCIELGKSDAELDTLGVYLPSVMRQAKAGDFFFFIGIDMPHLYVKWGEERVDNWKKDNLSEKKDIKPTWVVQTDRVRLNNEGKEDALIRKLHPGDTLRLADKRFIEGDYETLYLSSLTYTYREPTSDDAALNPDVEIVLSDSYSTSANPVATLQGEVSALAKQVGSISNVEQIVRAVSDKLYLRKDGIADRSMSPTEFASLLTSLGFRSGMVGGAGWGIYKDENGNWVIEADRFMARQELEVNNLVVNQVTGQGGTIVESAARMEITRVEENPLDYKCYFDQHEGTVANMFHVDDIAWNSRFTAEDEDLSFYRRRVTEVGADYVVLSKTYVNGTGEPGEGDVIVQYGNYTDKTRQYVKVRDVIGGGYERYIEGLDSVNAEGVEYYFVGRQDGQNPRWFIGNKDLVPNSGKGDGSFIEYKDRVFNLNNVVLSVGSKIGDKTINELVESLDNSKYLREALNQSTTIKNGLVLTSAVLLGYTNKLGERITMAGHSGLYNNPKSIASFWGGPMVDRFYDEDGNKLGTPLLSGFAASLVRMDGSAYWANGNVGWETDGSGWLGNYENGIRFDSLGSMTFGSGIKINLNSGVEGLKETLESLLNFNAGITHFFVPCNAKGEEISWQEASQDDGAGGYLCKSLKAKVGMWSEKFMSVRGLNPDGGAGGTGASFGLLTDWSQYVAGNGDALGADLGVTLREAVSSNTNAISLLSTRMSALEGKEFVTLNTTQEITGQKTHKGNVIISNMLYFKAASQSYGIYLISRSDNGALQFSQHNNYIWQKNIGNVDIDGNMTMNSFIKSGGTASQFLKADGSVDGNSYALTSALDNCVKKSGDTMSGALYIKNGVFSCENGDKSISININGNTFFGPSISSDNLFSLGRVGARWSNLYATTINVSSTALVSNLNADLLDGLHHTAFARADQSPAVDLNTVNGIGMFSNPLSASATTERHYPINEAGCLIYCTAAYSSANQIYGSFNSNRWFARGGAGWNTDNPKTSWREFAFKDDNVASATRLQGTYSLWGQSFFGNNVSGDMTGVGSITASGRNTVKAALLTNNTMWASDYGHFRAQSSRAVNAYTVGFGPSEDGYGLLQSSQISVGPIPLLINPQGGNVGIGLSNPTATLDVNGTGLFRGNLTTSATLRGMDTYVNQLFFSESTTDTQVRPYLSGYSSKFNVAFHKNGVWQKTPLMLDFNGNMDLTGVFHATQGVWSDGYISCRGKDTSDMRIKNRLEDIELDLVDIANAPIFNFTFKDTGKWSQGTSAQYMEKILPSVVWNDPNGLKAMDYGRAAFISGVTTTREVIRIGNTLLQVCQTQKTHEDRIATLENENKELKKEITRLQTILNN